jgi:hypothetical protein
MSTERHKFEYANRHNIADKETTDINVAKELAPSRVFGHGNTREIFLIYLCRGSLGRPKVAEDFPHVVHLLAALTGSNILGFTGRKGHTVLTTRLPSDSATVEHDEVSRMRATRVHIGCPVRINPAPESIRKHVNTLVEDRLIVSATQVA